MTETIETDFTSEDENSSPERRLIKDFYLSFKFSQGDYQLQERLLNLLSRYYEKHLTPEAKDWIATNRDRVISRFVSMRPPKAHIPTSEDDVVSSFEFGGTVLFDYLNGSRERGEVKLDDICNDMAYHDKGAQQGSRATSPSDPHKSHLREYVLFQKTTGSEAFDSIFHEAALILRQDIQTGEIDNIQQVKALQPLWEQSHPGESFFPDGFTAQP